MLTAARVYWVLFGLGLAVWALAVWQLGLWKQPHHAEWGALLAALPWWPTRGLALLLVVDDAYQHVRQWASGAPGYVSPVHRAWVWCAVRLARSSWCPRWLARLVLT